MRIYKRISYVQTHAGWQTYIHPVDEEFIRFKLLTTQSELTAAIAQCKQAGWQVINATKLVEKLSLLATNHTLGANAQILGIYWR